MPGRLRHFTASPRVVGAFLLLLLASPSRATPTPVLAIDSVVKLEVGGDFTTASIVKSGGRTRFLKSQLGSPNGTRYNSFAADLLASRIFARVGVRAPQCRVATLAPAGPVFARLGNPVLDVDFVDDAFAGSPVRPGHWPGRSHADTAAYLRMLVVDVLIGNSDRRDENFFVAGPEAALFPIALDNNGSFGTLVSWLDPAGPLHFVPSYQGLGSSELLAELGTVQAILNDAEPFRQMLADPEVLAQLPTIARTVVATLDDGFLGALVADLPAEVLPKDLEVDPSSPDWDWHGILAPHELAQLYEGLAPDSPKLSGPALMANHRAWIVATLAWRRDHLLEALAAYMAWRSTDPETLDEVAYFTRSPPRILPPGKPKSPAPDPGYAPPPRSPCRSPMTPSPASAPSPWHSPTPTRP